MKSMKKKVTRRDKASAQIKSMKKKRSGRDYSAIKSMKKKVPVPPPFQLCPAGLHRLDRVDSQGICVECQGMIDNW